MLVNPPRSPVALERGHPLPLPPSRGTEIVCEAGSIWITQDHDIRDIVLGPGQRFTLDVDAPAILQAFDDATVSIRRPMPVRRR